jgi:NAD(P)-dependent dehydrogenase (short-subunit alcohol dehydrogenase family)
MMLEKKTVLVIGGSSGIGLAVATLAAQAGGRIVLIGRDADKLTDVTQKFAAHKRDVRAYSIDATDDDALQAVMSELCEVDHVVSMVGGGLEGVFVANSSLGVVDDIESRALAASRIAKVVAPHLNAGGSLTLTSGPSGAAHNGLGAVVGNAAIRLQVEKLAVDLAPKIRVNAVAPTWMDTPMWRKVSEEQREVQKARVAGAIPLGRTATIAEGGVCILVRDRK